MTGVKSLLKEPIATRDCLAKDGFGNLESLQKSNILDIVKGGTYIKLYTLSLGMRIE